jgi:hypothetical protein
MFLRCLLAGMPREELFQEDVADSIWTTLFTAGPVDSRRVLLPDVTATNRVKRFYRVLAEA